MSNLMPKELELAIDYLSSECHLDTLEALSQTRDAYHTMRKTIKDTALAGDIEGMYELINKEYPELLKNHPNVVSLIFSQIFIEYVRSNKPEKALEFGRKSIHIGQDIATNQELFLLLAYKNPEKCDELKGLMDIQRRQMIFELVDGLIKESKQGRKASLLEYAHKIIQYCEAMDNEE
ncbi:hypothetical protein NERG_01377 [Nematocida ausubeli]|uniref:CTLH domain-containing protein n=1 Tax=Nematocida ausubeli (strain ATCC PRA-371 / ERTm2) TaxID=1913371 RepID=H8ZCD4_NEMA1|nr:hypothetical protein NERG_01377 [Nematocida ausubeli]